MITHNSLKENGIWQYNMRRATAWCCATPSLVFARACSRTRRLLLDANPYHHHHARLEQAVAIVHGDFHRQALRHLNEVR